MSEHRIVQAVIVGIAGRMGNIIFQMIQDTPQIKAVAGIEREGHPLVNQPFQNAAGKTFGDVIVRGSIDDVDVPVDVIIDFSTPVSSREILSFVRERKCPLVLGTTGFDKESIDEIGSTAGIAPVVFSPNMSIGVNLLFELTRIVSTTLQDGFDIEIFEAHHRHKKDAPSGTALKLGEIAAAARKQVLSDVARMTRYGEIGERPAGEIGFQTLRAGSIVGEHTVFFISDDEQIEISHRARSRSIFARGAVKAALWIVHQPAGLYTMSDVLFS